jgi:hypothetical protein
MSAPPKDRFVKKASQRPSGLASAARLLGRRFQVVISLNPEVMGSGESVPMKVCEPDVH